MGLLAYRADVADATAAEIAAEGMLGDTASDIFFMITSTDTSAATALCTVYRVDTTATGDMTLTSLSTFVNELDEFTIANSGTITTAA